MTAGYGTIDNPLSLVDALSWSKINPGDTVYLRGGTYTGLFTSSLSGTSENPIIIRPYPGERPIIDGKLNIYGSNTHWYGLEIIDSDMPRTSPYAGDVGDIPPSGLEVYATGVKLYNCIFHDNRGPGFWASAEGGEMNGCLSYYIGWQGLDRGAGHALYIQNTTNTKYIKDCIFFDCFGWGVHAYTQNPNNLNNLNFSGVVSARNGILNSPTKTYKNFLIGGWGEADDLYNLTMTSCFSYGSTGMDIGYNSGGDLATLTDLYSPDGILIRDDLTNVTNTNPYSGPAIGNQVFIRALDYTTGRGHIIIYNQAQANSVSVDVNSILSDGDDYILRNVQDYWTDTVSGTLSGDSIDIDMRAASHTVSSPLGTDAPDAPAKMFPDFGIFVLEKV